MKRFLLLFVFLLLLNPFIKAQDQIAEVIVPEHALKKIPKKTRKDVRLLTEHLIEPCETDREKVLAIFTWISDNIKYDVKTLVNKDIEPQSVNETLSRKKGVCYHYTELFNTMCELAGIKSITVSGYAKGLGYRKGSPFIRANHAWNLVNIDGEWLNVDMTWGSGFVWYYDVADEKESEKASKKSSISSKLKYYKNPDYSYFAFPASDFIKDHFPWTQEFQLLNNPVGIEEYEKDDGLVINDELVFDYEAKMDANANMQKRALQYKMGYDSYLYNPRNHFDRAVTIIIENYGLFMNAEVKASDKNKYENVHAMFVDAEDLLKKHKGILDEVNKERENQIKDMEKSGESIPTISKKLDPLKNSSIKVATNPLNSQIKSLKKTIESNDEKISSYESKLGIAKKSSHTMGQHTEWVSLQASMKKYEIALDSLNIVQDQINTLTAYYLEEIAGLNQCLRVKCEEHVINDKIKYCNGFLEQLRSDKELQKNISKRIGIYRKEISTYQNGVRQKINSEGIVIKKELRADKENAALQNKMNQNISNFIAFYENTGDVNDLKYKFYNDQILRIKVNSLLFKEISKKSTVYEEQMEEHIEFLNEGTETNFTNEKKLMEEWLEYAISEKKRLGKYVTKSKKVKRG